MLKGKTIYLRMIEPEDIELTYKWHNDYEIQKMTCGPIRFVSKEIEKNWIMSKTASNNKDIYLSICSIKDNRMIGIISINDIDYLNRKCHIGGIVIGDKEYRDGDAYRESQLIVKDYIFEQLNMNKVTGACLKNHILSRANLEASGYKLEGIFRDEVFKNGQFHDVYFYSILRSEYLENREILENSEKFSLRLAKNVQRIRKELKDIN